MHFKEHSVRRLTDEQCIEVLGTYVHHVSQGFNLQRKKDLSAQSMRNYLKAAQSVLQLWLRRLVPLHDKNHMGQQSRYHAFLGQQFRDRRNWTRKRPQKLPFTREMYCAFQRRLRILSHSSDAFVAAEWAVYDWMRLGAFTGFRPSEFAQSKVAKGEQFLTLPVSDDVPEDQRGAPVAFVLADFTFYTSDMHIVPHPRLGQLYHQGRVKFVQLRWRFDKSANNFVLRKYSTTGEDILDPVDAAVHIVLRALFLGVSTSEPVGVWRSAPKRPYRFLRSTTITQVLRQVVIWAYPDPKHFYRENITSIVPHGLRVTAAVYQKLGGAANDDIAQKLRWHLTSVPTYLRDGFESAQASQHPTLQGFDNS